jgi:hypothetical protein
MTTRWSCLRGTPARALRLGASVRRQKRLQNLRDVLGATATSFSRSRVPDARSSQFGRRNPQLFSGLSKFFGLRR